MPKQEEPEQAAPDREQAEPSRPIDAAIGRYQLRRIVGTGAFATVYEAHDEGLDQAVAIKVLAENHSANPDMRERFVREAQAIRRVTSRSVITVHDIGETPRGQPYLISELLAGGDLSERLAELGSLDWTVSRHELRALVNFLAVAMTAVHNHGLVHRDIAPSNILLRAPLDEQRPRLGDSDTFVLGDFGLVKDLAVASGLTVGAGTTGFSAPEQQHTHSIVDHRADLFGASAVVAAVAKHADPQASWLRSFEQALAIGMSANADDRPPDAAMWQHALLEALDSDGPGTVGGLRRLLVGVGAAVVAVLAGFVWWAQSGAPPEAVSAARIEPTLVVETTAVPDQPTEAAGTGPSSGAAASPLANGTADENPLRPIEPTSTPTATAAPEPTTPASPQPVATAPTATQQPTPTSAPTATTEPTATPIPTTTPEPTATLEPTVEPTPTLEPTTAPTATPVASAITIFDDGLAAEWFNQSWGATEFTFDGAGRNGAGITAALDGFGAVSLATGSAITTPAWITFWVRTTSADPQLAIRLNDRDGIAGQPCLLTTADLATPGTIGATWSHVQFALDRFPTSTGEITRVSVIDRSGEPQVLDIDELKLAPSPLAASGQTGCAS